MSIDYATWAAQQHQYLMAAGGYGGMPPAPPPDQQAPPPDAPIPNYDGGAAPVDPTSAPPPPPPDQSAPAPVAPAPSNSTWGGMASAPPPQEAPPPPPPDGPTLGPSGPNSWGPAQGSDLAPPPDLTQNGDQYNPGGLPPQPDNPDQQVPPMDAPSAPGAPPVSAWLGQAVQTAAPALKLVPGGPLAVAVTAESPRAQADRAAAQRAAAAPSPGLGGVPVPPPPPPAWTGHPTSLTQPAQQHNAAASRYQADISLAHGADAYAPIPPPPPPPPPMTVDASMGGGGAPNAATTSALEHGRAVGNAIMSRGSDTSLPKGHVGADSLADQDYLATLKTQAQEDALLPRGQLTPEQQAIEDSYKTLPQTLQTLPKGHVGYDPQAEAAFFAHYNAANAARQAAGLDPLPQLAEVTGARPAADQGLGGKIMDAVGAADLMRQGNVEHITAEARGAADEQAIPGWDQYQSNVVLKDYVQWIGTNRNEANYLAQNGYTDPTTGTHFDGDRAVWESWIHDKPAWQKIMLDMGADPLTYLPPADKAVEGVGVTARLAERALPEGSAAARAAGSVGKAAETLHPIVEHPLQGIGSHIPEAWYPAEVQAARRERAVAAAAEEALNTPSVRPDPQAAPQGPPSQPMPAPPNLPSPNGHTPPVPIPTNGHVPTTALPPVTIPPTSDVAPAVEGALPTDASPLSARPAPASGPDWRTATEMDVDATDGQGRPVMRGTPTTTTDGLPAQDYGHDVQVVKRQRPYANGRQGERTVWTVEDATTGDPVGSQAEYTNVATARSAARHTAWDREQQARQAASAPPGNAANLGESPPPAPDQLPPSPLGPAADQPRQMAQTGQVPGQAQTAVHDAARQAGNAPTGAPTLPPTPTLSGPRAWEVTRQTPGGRDVWQERPTSGGDMARAFQSGDRYVVDNRYVVHQQGLGGDWFVYDIADTGYDHPLSPAFKHTVDTTGGVLRSQGQDDAFTFADRLLDQASPAPPTAAQTAVHDAQRAAGNAPAAAPPVASMDQVRYLGDQRRVPGVTRLDPTTGAPLQDFGEDVHVVKSGDAYQVLDHGRPVGDPQDYATARKQAQDQAIGRNLQAAQQHLLTVDPAEWKTEAVGQLRQKLYNFGVWSKTAGHNGAAYGQMLDDLATRVQTFGEPVVDGIKAEVRDKAGLSFDTLNNVLERAGQAKLPDDTFFTGTGPLVKTWMPGERVRTPGPESVVGTVKGPLGTSHIRISTPLGEKQFPADALERHPLEADTRSSQALGIQPRRPPDILGGLRRNLPSPLDHQVIPTDLSNPVIRNDWFDHLLGPEGRAAASEKINTGTFTKPKFEEVGGILKRETEYWQGYRDLANGHADVAPPSAAKPWGGRDWQRLFDAGVVDATGVLDDGKLNKQLVRLGVADNKGELTDLGASLGAKTVDEAKANIAALDDPLMRHLLVQPVAEDWSISHGLRDAGSRAMIDKRLALTKKWDGMVGIYSSAILGNPASAPKNILSNVIGDGLAAIVNGPVTAINYVDPLELKKLWGQAKDARITSDFEDILSHAGLPKTDLLREVGPLSKGVLEHADFLGPLRAPIKAVMAPDWARRLINIPDGRIRTAAAKTRWGQLYPRMLAQLPDKVDEAFTGINRALAAGHVPFPDWSDELAQRMRELRSPDPAAGRVVSAQDLRANLLDFFDGKRLANPGVPMPGRDVWKARVADPIAEAWGRGLKGVADEAMQEVRRAAVDFTPTRFDEVAHRIWLFHFWNSRAGANYAIEALKNPKYIAGFVRGMNGLEQASQADNAPPFLKWMAKYSQSPDGLAMWLAPESLVSMWSTGLVLNLMDPEDPTKKKDLTGLGHVVEGPIGSLLFMVPPVKAALAVIGALGPDAKTPDLIPGSQAVMQRFETLLNEANIGHPFHTDAAGNPARITLPDSRTAVNAAMVWVHQMDARFGLNPQNTNAGDNITFRELMLDQEQKLHPGMTQAQLNGEAAKDEQDPRSAAYKGAYGTFVTSQTAGPGTGHGTIGDVAGWAARMIGGNSTFTTSVQSADARQAKIGNAADNKTANNYVFTADAKSATLDAANNDYKTAGGDDRVYYDRYSAIKFGHATVRDDNGGLVTDPQLQAMTPEARQHLADLWLSQQPNGPAAIQKVYDAQDKILQANPDLAGSKAMRQLADANPAGADEWIATVRQRNPGFDAYMADAERKGAVKGTDDYRNAAFYLDGYRALVGQPRGYNGVAQDNPHPDVPGLENGETLSEHFFAQQAAARGTSADKTQEVSDSVQALGAVKAKMDAADPSGTLWASYRDYVIGQAALPRDQQDKYIPKLYYDYAKGAFKTADGSAGNYPSFYATDYMRWAQSQPDGAPLDVASYWKLTATQRALYAQQQDAQTTAFDPASLVGKTSAPATATPAATDQPPAQGQAVTTVDLNLRDGPNGNIVGVGPGGTVVDIIGVQGDWAQVRLADGSTGWMWAQKLKKQ